MTVGVLSIQVDHHPPIGYRNQLLKPIRQQKLLRFLLAIFSWQRYPCESPLQLLLLLVSLCKADVLVGVVCSELWSY